MKHTNCNNNNNKYINNSKQDEWSSAGWSIDSIRLLASKPRFHHPTPRLRRDLYVYTTLFGHHCLIWSYMYPFYHLVPSLNLSLISCRARRPVFRQCLGSYPRVFSNAFDSFLYLAPSSCVNTRQQETYTIYLEKVFIINPLTKLKSLFIITIISL